MTGNSTGGSADPTGGDSTAYHESGDTPPEESGTQIANSDAARLSALLDMSPAATRRPEFPGYELLGELGRGGMGVVYHARNLGLNREAAIKVVRAGSDAKPAEILRFLAEAEAVAALKHPHVVSVYEVSQQQPQPYIAFEYLPGGTLADRLKPAPGSEEPVRLTPKVAANLLGKLASGVAAAHAAGVVHRDIKPGNVMFDAAGEPKLTDFGIAKRAASELTLTGDVIGTPDYMSPEQAKGDTKFVGPQADVWALGVVLFECVAGTRPFRADTVPATLERVKTVDPPRLRRLVPTAPRDLEWICRKCLEKNPTDRYPSAKELADDLDRFARGAALASRPPGPVRQAARWARRNPVPTAVGLVLFLALLGTTASALVALRSERAKFDAERRESEAKAQREASEEREQAERRARLIEERSNAILVAVLRGQFREAVAAYDRAEADGITLTPAMRLNRIRALHGFADTGRIRREFAALAFDELPADVRGSYELWKAVSLFGTDDAEAERLIRLALTRPLPDGDRAYAKGALAPTTPEAVAHFLDAVRHDYLHQPARSAACNLLHISGRLKEALDLAEQSEVLFPDLPDFPAVIMAVAALQGDEKLAQATAKRLSGRFPADVIDQFQAVSSALAANWRITRGSLGYGKAQPDDQQKVAAVEVRAGQFMLRGGEALMGKQFESLPPGSRKTLRTYADVYSALTHSQFTTVNTPEFRDRLAVATRAHPEGYLLLVQTMSEAFWAFSIQLTTPEATDERIRRFKAALETAERAAVAPSQFPVQDIAADLAFLFTALLSEPKQLGARADPAAAKRAIELLRARLRHWDEPPGAATLHSAVQVCLREKEHDLGRAVLDLWQRKLPGDLDALRARAEIELAAEAYPAAARAAERVLALHPNDARMKEIRDAALRRFVPFETAPPPREVTLSGSRSIPVRRTLQ